MKAVIFSWWLRDATFRGRQCCPKMGGNRRKTILLAIMQIHAAHGITEFVVALGYKGR